uniref:Phlebovirus glycoprotein G2 fusion domain-containing protein n=1 Tax=Strongyloides papillosus TaxID=174720 RepID=A0A0N5BPM5_STREA
MSSVNRIDIYNIHIMEDETTPIATIVHSNITTLGPSGNGIIETTNLNAKMEYSVTTETIISTTSIIIYNIESVISDTINEVLN